MGSELTKAQQAHNTDRELWREDHPEGEAYGYYAPSIHVTKMGGIGINVNGTIILKSLREWHALAGRTPDPELAKVTAERDEALKLLDEGWEPRIHRMRFEGGEFDAVLTGKSVEAIAVAMVTHFKAIGAENYFELNIYDRAEPFQRYNVTLQKVGKLSPADKANAAIARAEAAESLLASRTTAIEAAIEAMEALMDAYEVHDRFWFEARDSIAQLRSLIAGKETDVG